MVDPAGIFPALSRIFSSDAILTEPEDLVPYSFDGTAVIQQMPVAVVFARTAEQVAELVKEANAQKFSIVTRGSGTGLSGGSVPVEGGIVLCLSQMNRILEVDGRNLTTEACRKEKAH